VPVQSTLNLQDIKLADTKGKKFLLQGDPADKNVKPVESVFDIAGQTLIDLPAYSFTVLKFKL